MSARRRVRPVSAAEAEFYAGFEPVRHDAAATAPLTPENIIGRRVRLRRGHPHAGRIGVVESWANAAVGLGLAVRFPDGTGCMIFAASDAELLPA